MDVSVILPTYDERENIVPLISAIKDSLGKAGYVHEIVVVDDDSPDGTADAVRERYGDDASVSLYVRTQGRGLATAIAYGIRRAKGDVVVVMDTDFNHDPAILPQMVLFTQYYDIIIGSRFVMGGGMEEQWRYNASFLFNFVVRFIVHTQVQDNLCGFFSMPRSKLLKLDLDSIFFGYGEYFMHLLQSAWQEGYSIIEIPAYYPVRPAGYSKSRFLHMLLSYSFTALKVRLGLRHSPEGAS